jgi:transcriptional regulator with XRE-family HTH domain
VNGKAAVAPGDYLRTWRRRRQMSQLNLALQAEISQRHLSFLESGRASPSREMLLHLAERLEVPLRERNAMLLAAGFAPAYPERTLDHPSMAAAKGAIERVLKGHEPYPALAIDRHWNLLAANAAVGRLLTDIAGSRLLEPPINILRLSLHSEGLAPQIANFLEWRAHLLDRLRHQAAVTGDAVLGDLLREISAYSIHSDVQAHEQGPLIDRGGVLVPLTLVTKAGHLSFISTTTLFGTPRDITLSELALEAFFPADSATAAIMQQSAV